MKVLTGDLPPLQGQKETGAEPSQDVQSPTISPKNAAAIALLQTWAKEDATDDPEAIGKAEADVDEFLQNLNRNRIESGERPLLP